MEILCGCACISVAYKCLWRCTNWKFWNVEYKIHSAASLLYISGVLKVLCIVIAEASGQSTFVVTILCGLNTFLEKALVECCALLSVGWNTCISYIITLVLHRWKLVTGRHDWKLATSSCTLACTQANTDTHWLHTDYTLTSTHRVVKTDWYTVVLL